MTSLDLLNPGGIPYLHISLAIAFLVFTFFHVKLLIVPLFTKAAPQLALVEEEDTLDFIEVEPENTADEFETIPTQETAVNPPTPPAPSAPAATSASAVEDKSPKKKNKKAKKKSAKLAQQVPATVPPAKEETTSEDENSVGPYASDELSATVASPISAPATPVVDVPAFEVDEVKEQVTVTEIHILEPVVEFVEIKAPKTERINQKSALLKRVAAHLRLRVKNKSMGFQIDYTTFAMLPSTVNAPRECKIADSDVLNSPFDNVSLSPIDTVPVSPPVQRSELSAFGESSRFQNPMSISNLKAYSPEFVPTNFPAKTIREVTPMHTSTEYYQRPVSFEMLSQPEPHRASYNSHPHSLLPVTDFDMEVMLAAQMADDQMDPPSEENSNGEINECIPVLCKYGNSCSRTGCHFMHSMRPSVIRKCKYDNLCIRSDCHFSHPNGRPLLKAKPRAARRPTSKPEGKHRDNALGLPAGDLAARVMSLAAMGYQIPRGIGMSQQLPRQQRPPLITRIPRIPLMCQ